MYSVIIPSRTASNLRACIGALRAAGEGARVIVVDDGVEWPEDRELGWLGHYEVHYGVKPFVFSRNINIGIRAAGEDDVVLLNDDALLATAPGNPQTATFRALEVACDLWPKIGIVGAVTNLTGQPLQHPMGRGIRIVPHFAFVCVYIPRRTINLVGMLDERYNVPGYGSDPTVAGACEDRDYCLAVQKAGLKCAVHDFVYVDHGSLRSTFRGDPETGGDFSGNLALLKEKWKGEFTE